jgi:hypothetical protein
MEYPEFCKIKMHEILKEIISLPTYQIESNVNPISYLGTYIEKYNIVNHYCKLFFEEMEKYENIYNIKLSLEQKHNLFYSTQTCMPQYANRNKLPSIVNITIQSHYYETFIKNIYEYYPENIYKIEKCMKGDIYNLTSPTNSTNPTSTNTINPNTINPNTINSNTINSNTINSNSNYISLFPDIVLEPKQIYLVIIKITSLIQPSFTMILNAFVSNIKVSPLNYENCKINANENENENFRISIVDNTLNIGKPQNIDSNSCAKCNTSILNGYRHCIMKCCSSLYHLDCMLRNYNKEYTYNPETATVKYSYLSCDSCKTTKFMNDINDMNEHLQISKQTDSLLIMLNYID